MPARPILLFLAASLLLSAQPADAVRREIEAAYAKVFVALKNARSMDDLDEINRTFDTFDWQTISPGQSPRAWSDLRQYGFKGLWTPFQSEEFQIEKFELNGDTAVLTGKLRHVGTTGSVSFIPLKETWRRTVMGWKRAVHEKLAAPPPPR
jgi:hypothetical protein